MVRNEWQLQWRTNCRWTSCGWSFAEIWRKQTCGVHCKRWISRKVRLFTQSQRKGCIRWILLNLNSTFLKLNEPPTKRWQTPLQMLLPAQCGPGCMPRFTPLPAATEAVWLLACLISYHYRSGMGTRSKSPRPRRSNFQTRLDLRHDWGIKICVAVIAIVKLFFS